MKKETKKQRPIKKATSKSENLEVDVHNDALMVALGLRVPVLVPRDKSVWTKTPNEKRILRTTKYSSKGSQHFNIIPEKSIPVWGKLIIYLKKNAKYPKTTYSIECWQHQIQSIISNYRVVNKHSKLSENIVLKYVWNGKTYKPGTLPFWR